LKSDFGAVGDGVADDTSALLEAVGGVKFAAVIFIPAGELPSVSAERPWAEARYRL